MPVPIQCPECAAEATVPDALVGKTVRCKACQTAFPVRAAKAKPVKAVAADEDDSIFADRPARPAVVAPVKAKSKLPLVLAGVLGLVVVAGGGAAALLIGGPDKPEPVAVPEVARNTRPAPEPVAEAPVKPEKPTEPENPFAEVADPKPAPPAKPAPKKATPKPAPAAPKDDADDEGRSGITAPLQKAKPVGEGTGEGKGPPPEKTQPTQTEITRAKNAAVYIECETNTVSASGSGWFGVEDNLIVTNAHVVQMLSPSAPKPKKLTVFINPGTPKERKIEHAKLDIICVDRFADIAIIKVLNEKDLPTPLKMRPSQELRDLEPLVVIGYPGGRLVSRLNKGEGPPQVTTNRTGFSTLNTDGDGNLYAVQTSGGAAPGNSGGPVVDANGDVVAVLVRGPSDVQYASLINYGVPTEFVSGVLAGRVGDIEYGQAYKKDGKVRVPVTATVLDPFQRMNEVGFGVWVGDTDGKRRPPGKDRTPDPADSGYREVKLTYKWAKDKQTATGELEFPDAPAGRTYWAQPYYSNALTAKNFLAGNAVKLDGPPVDLDDADLVARYKPGSARPVTLANQRFLEEFVVGEGSEVSEKNLLTTEIKAVETVAPLNRPADGVVARLVVRYETLKLKLERGEQKLDVLRKVLPKQLLAAMDEIIKQVQGIADVKNNGEIVKVQSDLRAAREFTQFFQQFSADAMESLQQASVPLPKEKVKPGFKWQGPDRSVTFTITFGVAPTDGEEPGDGGDKPPGDNSALAQPRRQPAARKPVEYKYTEQRSYTYHGTRTRNGVKEAVVTMTGVIKPAAAAAGSGATGSLKGHAYIDLDTGTVLESQVKRQFEMDSSGDGEKKMIAGLNVYKVTRGSVVGR